MPTPAKISCHGNGSGCTFKVLGHRHYRVDALETQMATMRLEMQQLSREMAQLRPLVPLVQSISKELGLKSEVLRVHMYFHLLSGNLPKYH